MRTRHLLMSSMVLLYCGIINAQSTKSKNYFVTKRKDTTFCKELAYGTTAQGYLNKIGYVGLKGKKVELKGRKNVPDVVTFYLNGTSIDKIPLKANNPNSYIRYTERVVDGKLKVYLAQQGYNSAIQYTPGSPHGDFSTGGPTGTYRFFIKIPNGTYYKINSKGNMNKYIKPYLLKCKEFNNQYKGDFSTREKPFMEMIKTYNKLCQ